MKSVMPSERTAQFPTPTLCTFSTLLCPPDSLSSDCLLGDIQHKAQDSFFWRSDGVCGDIARLTLEEAAKYLPSFMLPNQVLNRREATAIDIERQDRT